MGTFENTLEKIKKTPTVKDITPKELQSFLNHYGFIFKRSKGSHFVYAYPFCPDKYFTISIPMHSPIKPAYIDKIREIIEEIER